MLWAVLNAVHVLSMPEREKKSKGKNTGSFDIARGNVHRSF